MASKGKKGTQRKLTAILCADVVGYSRLMNCRNGNPSHSYPAQTIYPRRESAHRSSWLMGLLFEKDINSGDAAL